MNKWLLALALTAAPFTCEAAKVLVTWTNPAQNTDGTAYTNPKHILLEWGTCAGSKFGTRQAAILVPQSVAVTQAFIYPSGLSRVCVRAYAVNTDDVSSAPSNTASKQLLPSTGKPVTLGQPVIIE